VGFRPTLPQRASGWFGKFYDRKTIKRDPEFILYYHLTIVKLVARLLFFIFAFYFFLSGHRRGSLN